MIWSVPRLEDEQLAHAQTQAELLSAKLELDRLRGILSRVGRVDKTRAAMAVGNRPDRSPSYLSGSMITCFPVSYSRVTRSTR